MLCLITILFDSFHSEFVRNERSPVQTFFTTKGKKPNICQLNTHIYVHVDPQTLKTHFTSSLFLSVCSPVHNTTAAANRSAECRWVRASVSANAKFESQKAPLIQVFMRLRSGLLLCFGFWFSACCLCLLWLLLAWLACCCSCSSLCFCLWLWLCSLFCLSCFS